ncbi:MAG TPA: GNAT family N-acetyltransferase, partial [Pseudoxanthomonas sp.]|nr:GNAT family N-acetyltransferase [Pseudoxanthomonas sp.]
AQALAWLRDGPWAGYARHGHGLLAVEPRAGGAPMGICGLLLREGLPAPDLGLALLPQHQGRGYAHEAASAVLGHARGVLGIGRVLAIVAPGNVRSVALMRRLGLEDAGTVRLPGQSAALLLFQTPGP